MHGFDGVDAIVVVNVEVGNFVEDDNVDCRVVVVDDNGGKTLAKNCPGITLLPGGEYWLTQ